MLSEIGSVDNIPEFIEGVKARLLSLFFLFPICKEWWWHDDLLFSAPAFLA